MIKFNNIRFKFKIHFYNQKHANLKLMTMNNKNKDYKKIIS